MPLSWSIKPEWELLETGALEERAGFSALGICTYGVWLTAGHDRLVQSVRQAPYLSAYHLAEWLAWNWWRLRWEPRRTSIDWKQSHSMASIGNGYVWPNIEMISDGQMVMLVSLPTPERTRTPYRYINDSVSAIPVADFENEVDLFIDVVLQRLQDFGVKNSNLADIWQAVQSERQDPALARSRKLEALLGEDPGEIDATVLAQFVANIEATGETALNEIAANRLSGQVIPNIASLLEMGQKQGVAVYPKDQVSLRNPVSSVFDAAWKLGTHAAQQLRGQERIASDMPLANSRLAELFGAPCDLLTAQPPLSPKLDLSFAISRSHQEGRVLLRSQWENGRRFELARLLGDALITCGSEPLRPATRSNTYRQKIQRAFAVELLSPFDAVEAMLEGDYSMESQQDVAHHFQVSELTIRTLLVNHGRVDRSELDRVFE
jgi:hypothetical protein